MTIGLANPKSSTLARRVAARRSECTGALEDDVGRLQVAMDDPFIMRSLERLGDSACEGQRFGHFHWSLSYLIPRASGLRRIDRTNALRPWVSLQIHRCCDVRMIQRGGHARFARENGHDAHVNRAEG